MTTCWPELRRIYHSVHLCSMDHSSSGEDAARAARAARAWILSGPGINTHRSCMFMHHVRRGNHFKLRAETSHEVGSALSHCCKFLITLFGPPMSTHPVFFVLFWVGGLVTPIPDCLLTSDMAQSVGPTHLTNGDGPRRLKPAPYPFGTTVPSGRRYPPGRVVGVVPRRSCWRTTKSFAA